MGIEINLEELEFYLTGLSKKISTETIDSILLESSEPCINALEKNVPVDTSELKGTLGVIKIEGDGVNRKIHFGSTSEDRAVVERAYYQEYGHSSMMGTKWISKSAIESYDEALEKMNNKVVEILNDK